MLVSGTKLRFEHKTKHLRRYRHTGVILVYSIGGHHEIQKGNYYNRLRMDLLNLNCSIQMFLVLNYHTFRKLQVCIKRDMDLKKHLWCKGASIAKYGKIFVSINHLCLSNPLPHIPWRHCHRLPGGWYRFYNPCIPYGCPL